MAHEVHQKYIKKGVKLNNYRIHGIVRTKGTDMDIVDGSVMQTGDTARLYTEQYGFVWPGKAASCREAETPSGKQLCPDIDASLDYENALNIYIEGDNIDALKLLQKDWAGKIQVVYIDPPYNTGKDFIYHDDFSVTRSEYGRTAGGICGSCANPQHHASWCSMIYPRLILARRLMADDGVIFISIDDNEQANLKQICDELFGEDNFINTFMWLHGKGKKTLQSRTLQQYILAYAKNKKCLGPWTEKAYNNYTFTNPDEDPRGKWFSGSLSFTEQRSNPGHPNYYTITSPSGVQWTRQWQVTEAEMDELIAAGDIFWGSEPAFDSVPRRKIRPGSIDIIPGNIISGCGTTKSAVTDLDRLMGCHCFDYPKPVGLIQKLLTYYDTRNAVVLDFFSGSATTAHAVMEQNAEDGGTRRYIMVQLAEHVPADSEAYRAGFRTIADIGRERIRRAAAETGCSTESGFRVYDVRMI